jgi:acetylornithine deacetylase/succinyl-diaminopimelate desuccinylase-like protein
MSGRTGNTDLANAAIDWEGALWDTIAHLQTLIRIETVNPPGNEIGVARYLDDVLRGAEIETKPAPARAALVGRIRAAGARRARPLLLLAHMDVVGVERARWTSNPFGGEIQDGYLYGRGAIDDKGMLAVNLQTMLLVQRCLREQRVQLSRDLVFVATGDEEAGGVYGIDWLAAREPALLEAEYALNEGGRVRIVDGRPLYCAVQCAEKVAHVIRLTARGPAGHAAIPLPGNAIARLSRALVALGGHAEPVELSDVTQRFFAALAEVWPEPRVAMAMRDVASSDPARHRDGARALAAWPNFDALLRTGVSPTILAGGVRANVIPAEASATLNVRTLPGQSLDAVLSRLRAVINDDLVELAVDARGRESPAVPVRSAMMDAITRSVAALDPNIRVMPYLSTGGTDSAVLRRLGVHAYGLLPFPLTQDDEDRMHGHDERVPVSSLGFGVHLVFDVVRRLALA